MNQLELLLKRKGKDATLHNWTKTGESEYDNDTYDESTTTINVIVERENDASYATGSAGQVPQGEARIYASSDYEYHDNEDERASQLDVDGQTWEVMQVDPKGKGLTVLQSERVA